MIYQFIPLKICVNFHSREYLVVSHRPTSSYGNANQVVDKSKYKVDSDPLHGLFREINASNHIQEVILYKE